MNEIDKNLLDILYKKEQLLIALINVITEERNYYRDKCIKLEND